MFAPHAVIIAGIRRLSSLIVRNLIAFAAFTTEVAIAIIYGDDLAFCSVLRGSWIVRSRIARLAKSVDSPAEDETAY